MAPTYPDIHDSFSPSFSRLSRTSNNTPMYPYQQQLQSQFLSLPVELRLQIYSYCVLPATNGKGSQLSGLVSNDHHNYYTGLSNASSKADEHAMRTLEIRTLDPTQPQQYLSTKPRLRTQLSIRTSRFRARTMSTTYALAHNPGIHTAIMLACRQCHAEAAPLLYAGHTFSFSTHVEAVEPFLQDLTPYSRACIKAVGLVKRGLPYEREFDRAEWEAACAYLGSGASGLTSLRQLKLGVVAGCPGPSGWDDVRSFSKEEFLDHLGRAGKGGNATTPQFEYRNFMGVRCAVEVSSVEDEEWRGMQWVGQLTGIEGFKEVDVKAIVEHCPPPMSGRMEFWISFSKSVEDGFARYLKESMIAEY